jgi:hypothetical protein
MGQGKQNHLHVLDIVCFGHCRKNSLHRSGLRNLDKDQNHRNAESTPRCHNPHSSTASARIPGRSKHRIHIAAIARLAPQSQRHLLCFFHITFSLLPYVPYLLPYLLHFTFYLILPYLTAPTTSASCFDLFKLRIL